MRQQRTGVGGIHASTLQRTIYIMIVYISCISAGAPEEAIKLAQKTRGLYCYHPGRQIIVSRHKGWWAVATTPSSYV